MNKNILSIIEDSSLSNIEKVDEIKRNNKEEIRDKEKITIKRAIMEKYKASTTYKIPVLVSIGGVAQPKLAEGVAIKQVSSKIEKMAIYDGINFTWSDNGDAATYERKWLHNALDIVFNKLTNGKVS